MADGGKLAESWARIASRPRPAVPWRDGTAFPWADPAFSERMLRLHLDQTTHMASRTRPVIAAHVDWLCARMDAELGPGATRRVLDVACGPGLYCHELARRGHRALGCDVAPAPLRHARETAAAERLDCEFSVADLDAPDLTLPAAAVDLDAVTLWYGEVHSHPPDLVRATLASLASRLHPGGLLAIEYQPWHLYPREDRSDWQACDVSPFADAPHLWLQEYFWDDAQRSEINVHWILDAASGRLERYAQCGRAWRDGELAGICADAGCGGPVFWPPITGVDESFEFAMLTVTRD